MLMLLMDALNATSTGGSSNFIWVLPLVVGFLEKKKQDLDDIKSGHRDS